MQIIVQRSNYNLSSVAILLILGIVSKLSLFSLSGLTVIQVWKLKERETSEQNCDRLGNLDKEIYIVFTNDSFQPQHLSETKGNMV